MRKVFKALVIGIGAAAFSMLGYFSGRLDERYEYENAKCVPEEDLKMNAVLAASLRLKMMAKKLHLILCNLR
jgi:hypothetical protein